jgi:hypothetical protein
MLGFILNKIDASTCNDFCMLGCLCSLVLRNINKLIINGTSLNEAAGDASLFSNKTCKINIVIVNGCTLSDVLRNYKFKVKICKSLNLHSWTLFYMFSVHKIVHQLKL